MSEILIITFALPIMVIYAAIGFFVAAALDESDSGLIIGLWPIVLVFLAIFGLFSLANYLGTKLNEKLGGK